MKIHLFVILSITILILTACKTGPVKTQRIAGYNFKSPDASVIMPAVLQEISGITYIDTSTLGCIQDEKGILFFYDILRNEISRQKEFYSNGDYEGIARIEDTIYVLRSDGVLYEIADFKSDNIIVTPFKTEIPSKDNEGLCYDGESDRLLIACKENTGKGDLSKDNRYIFGFDLTSKNMIMEPEFTFDIDGLKEFAKTNNIDLPLKNSKRGLAVEADLKFQASGIAIHPFTGKLYLLSAEDHMLFIFDKSGSVQHMIRLNQVMFNQPEGITFLENGDMFISNEGPGKGPATLLRFNYKSE
jgi:uncharacterized protein YjiK